MKTAGAFSYRHSTSIVYAAIPLTINYDFYQEEKNVRPSKETFTYSVGFIWTGRETFTCLLSKIYSNIFCLDVSLLAKSTYV